VSYDYVQYLYNHVRCCQLRALHDCFRHVSKFLCQIRDFVRNAVHRSRVLYSSACAVHPASCLGIGIMPIQARSSHLFTELSDYHTCCKTPDSQPWSRKLLCFRKWTDCHSIFCHWLNIITVFSVPSCSPRWIQHSTGPRPWFPWTFCA